MRKSCYGIAVGIALILMAHGTVTAQSVLSSISGTVTDPSGHVVPGAKVVAHETTTGVDSTQKSNDAGMYSFAGLPPGSYTIKVRASGFKEETSSPIILVSAQKVKFDAPLQVGGTTETVEVSSTPPTMNTVDSELSELVTGAEARKNAISRSTLALVASNPTSVADGSSVMLGGQRASYANLTIDGITTVNNLYGGQSGGMTADQSFESIAEVKVTDNNGSAESPGFGSLITTTKSGGNKLRGSMFYTTDNQALNSTPFLYPSSEKGKGPELQWYGLSVGGPVVLPKLYNGHDKTFFFFTWEHRTFPLAAGNTTALQTNLPTTAFLSGNFGSLLPSIQLINPYTGVAFAGNQISPSSSVATALQSNYYPTLRNNGSADSYINNYDILATSPEHINREDYKIDHHFNSKSTLSGRYTRQYDPQPTHYDAGTLLLGHAKIATFENAFLSYTYIFTQNLVNEFRLGFSRDARDYAPFHDGNSVLTKIGLQGISAPAGTGGFPNISFTASDIQGWYENPAQLAISNDFPILDNVSWQRGRHSIKVGTLVSIRRPQNSKGAGTQQFGTINFNGFATGFDYADFLLGIPSSVSLNENPPNRYNRHVDTGLFAQDSWTVSPKLTFTFGLRWEYYMPPTDHNDRRANFDPGYVSSSTGVLGAVVLPNVNAKKYLNPGLPAVLPIEVSPAGYPGSSMLSGNKGNLGPRLGVAYQVSPKMVIRGGWGLYYGLLVNAVQDGLAGGGVFGTQLAATNTITNGVPAFTFPNPFDSTGAKGNTACTSECLSVTGVDPHLKTPTSQEYNLTMERELPHSIVGRLAYRGYKTYHLPYTVDLTIPPAGYNNNSPTNLSASMFPLYSKITWTESGAIQNENSLEVGLYKKFMSGLTFQGEYSLAKNLTDDNGANKGDGESDSPMNPYNLKADYGNTFYIPRHRMTANSVYQLPIGKGKQFGGNMPKAADYIAGGWEFSGIMVFQTGNFLTPYYSSGSVTGGTQNIRTNGSTSLRPNCVSRPGVANATANEWFNNSTNPATAAFALPGVGQYGNCGVGIIQGPGLWSANFGAHKSIPVAESIHVRFEMNMMNAFNHPNKGNPGLNFSSSSFGTITSTAGGLAALVPTVTSTDGERHIWLGMRVEF